MKIICIEQNYQDAVGSEKSGEGFDANPQFFIKPDSALLRNNDPFYIPNFSSEMGFETEVVVKINRVVKSIEERFAYRCYDEIGLGIDFTARDVLRKAIEQGNPWEIAKSFDRSTAVSPQFISLSELGGDVEDLNFSMQLNGEPTQESNTVNMIFSIDKIISYVSQFVMLKMGDLIFTGTPSGAGVVNIGDRITASLEDKRLLDFYVK